MEPLSEPAPHATIVLAALDEKPLSGSSKLLLTALRRAENKNMGWNAARTSVGGIWGEGPVRVLGLRATLQLPPGGNWNATPLLADGSRPENPAATRRIGAEMLISPDDATIWWLLERRPEN